MNLALKQAARSLGNTGTNPPVGSVITDKKGNLISFGRTGSKGKPHAEFNAIKNSQKKLTNCNMFVTLEPCIMCAAAISEAHISRVYFGAYDEKKGSLESIMKIYNEKHYFIPDVYGGINEIECSKLLKNFFQDQRNK